MTDCVELLFFDTFAHDNSEELNLDLVQFPKPVYVTEVRIIPLGARVQADFPGGVRLGATNPSQFRIEFFVNDLGKRGASTFESLGGFEYNQNGCINLECVPDDTIRKIPTDGLVLRGWYTTITLAVYGTLTANIAEQIVSPVVTPALPAQPNTIVDVQQIVPQTALETEWSQDNIQPVPIEYTQQPATQYAQNYTQPEPYPQEYNEYYNEVPKDPRSYHQTPDAEWDGKQRSRSIEVERDRERTRDQPYQKPSSAEHDHRPDTDRRERSERERRYSRSHSRDRDRERSSRDYPDAGRERDHDRDRDRDWDHDRHEYRDRSKKDWDRDRDRDRDRERERDRDRDRERDRDRDRDRERERGDRDRDRDRDRVDRDRDRTDRDRTDRDRERDRDRDRDRERSYEHQDSYRRSYNREERDDARKRPRTPPMVSPKRPHTPHAERKELSPQEVEILSEEEPHSEKQKREKEETPKNVIKSPAKEVKEVQSPVVEEPPPMDVEEFEPILSDEDIVDDEHYQDIDYDYAAYTNNDDIIKQFVPGSTELQKYPTPPLYVIKETIELDEELKTVLGIADDFFKSSITEYKLKDFTKLDREIKEELVHLCEKVMTIIANKTHFCCIIEIYQKTRIFTNSFSEADKEIISQVKFITETLLDWIIIALDYGMANEQYKPCYKIRHIKCGIKLTEWCCNSIDFIQLLWQKQFYIDKVLLNLYQIEYMALSIKLMILRALDKYLQKRQTIEHFILGFDLKQNGYYENIPFAEQNGYKTLVELLRKNPLVRLKFALNSILKKLNIFEVLQKLHFTVSKIRNENYNFTFEDVKFLTKSLEQILHAAQNENFALSQPKRFLPVAAQFEINNIDADNVLIEFFKMHNLLEVFLILLTLPKTLNFSSIKSPICEILCQLLSTKEGLEYLTESYEVTNVIVKTLLQPDEDLQFSDSLEIRSHNLGLEIAYKIQAIYYLDALSNIGKSNSYDFDNVEVINSLHGLFCLTFMNIGKISVAEILCLGQNMDVLFAYTESVTEKSDSNFSKFRKSPSVCYIIDLIHLAVSHVINITFLEKYTGKIMQIIKQQDLFEGYIANKLAEVEPYLRPIYELEDPLRYDDISLHVEIINKHLDTIASYPPELITSLHIIKFLGISKHGNKSPVISENPLSNYIELKYKHVILQLYSLEGVNLLTKILSKICSHYEQPALHTHAFVSNQGVQIINIIQPSIELLRQMLTYVIQCRNTQFKDLTTVPILLQTFNLLRTFPTNAVLYFHIQKVCKDIVDTLLVYTQPVSDEIHEKDSLNKSLWSLMCGEVIKYITTAPYTFISGLLVFSELLPLPLPIHTLDELNSDEVSWAVNLRKLWSAHLHTHSNSIQELLTQMCITTNQPLLNLLRRVCVQLSDLAANSAIMIARGILDAIYTALIPKEENKNVSCNSNTTRLLNFLACLVTHSPLKCATLHLLHNTITTIKGDEKYPVLIESFCQILKSTNNTTTHIQAQECVLSIIQSFCDTEITLLQNFTEENISSEKHLANALPIKDHLMMYILTIIEHLTNENTFVTYLPTVRILLLLTEHDYGFYWLKDNLVKKGTVFANIMKYIEKNFSKDNDDCLTTLNILVQFLRVTLGPEEVDGTVLFKPRTMKMNVEELQGLLDWKNDDAKHPLIVMEEQLKEIFKEDNNFESLLNAVNSLIKVLNSNHSDEKENYQEPVLPLPEALLTQFAGRTVFTVAEAIDQRLTSSFWLSAPSEDTEGELENVTCDLLEICRQHLSQDTNLIREVEKLCRIYAIDKAEQAEKEKLTDQQKDKIKRPFVPNVRGRGFPRTIPQRADLFRSRPPNTSRPPSLHVDDFVALETCGAQPTGPTGYNKLSREFLATTRVVRGTRGRPFISQERTMQYRQMTWWGTPMGRGPYH